MDGTVFVVLSGALTFGVPLALAIRELFELKRRDDGRWDGDGSIPSKPNPPPRTGQKPLPDCLVPKLPAAPIRSRELEKA